MKNVAVVTDSNSGITQQQAREFGIYTIPMPFYINGETFYEDIDLTQEQFYEKMGEDADITTSMPAVGDVIDLWDKLLTEYKEVVYIPMSSGLSGSCETAIMLSKDYDGKVQVVNNQRISVPMRQSVLDAKTMAERGMGALEIRNYLEETKYDCSIYIMLDTLYYLKKGGRITPAAAALGTLLKLKPVLQIQGDKLDAFAKARTIKQGKNILIEAMQNDLSNRFLDPWAGQMWLMIAHTQNEGAAEELKNELLELYPGHEIIVNPLPLSIACHTGPGALGIGCCRKLL